MQLRASSLVALLASLHQPGEGWDNGLALTPPKGFATWNIWPFTGLSCCPAVPLTR
jgi:hypothetical protein